MDEFVIFKASVWSDFFESSKSSENLGALPYHGLILAHSNESEWQSFKANRNNEAFLDRICVIEVPYCLRYSEEAQIYDKILRQSELASAPCAPGQ